MSVRSHLGALNTEDVKKQPTERDLEVLQQWWGRIAPEVPAETRNVEGAAVGFDDGDFVIL